MKLKNTTIISRNFGNEMEKIEIKKTDRTPKIVLDKESGIFEISGASIPEDAIDFFSPAIKWIEKYVEKPNPKSVFNFNFKYFNSASSKIILDFILRLREIQNKGKEILIRWHYEEDDEDMEEIGRLYGGVSNIPFEYITYQ